MKKKSRLRRFGALLLCVPLLLTGCGNSQGGNPNDVKLDPEKPVTIAVWTYYNGEQLNAFNKLVDEFNETVGKESGILVESFSQGSVGDLESNVLDAVNRKVGASEPPNIFAAYADTAYKVDQMGLAVDLSPYFTQPELDAYVASYIEEGRFPGAEGIKIFPVAKSTEIFMMNETDWNKFADATGADVSALSTIEGVTATAKAYYEWTDSLTPEQNDGRAFFGRDAMANYLIIGSLELGQEIFAVADGKTALHFDRAVMKKIWDNYYSPYVRGYFSASSRFRSDDVKTGDIIALVGSSSAATFFPFEVIRSDTEIYPIEVQVLPCPHFQDGRKVAVQQGAGMVVTDAEPEEVYASVQFLKWFTAEERNVTFSVSSGYLPVIKAANDMKVVGKYVEGSSAVMEDILSISIDTVLNDELYTPKAFGNGTKGRNILEHSLSDQAIADRVLVEKNLQKGMSLEEAVAAFDNEENFNQWYETTRLELETLVK